MSPLIDFLGQVSFLAALPDEQLRQLAPLFGERRCRADEYLLRAGQDNDAFYLARTGRLVVRVERAGRSETITYLDPPALFGELSCLTGKPCSADVQAVVDSDVLVMPRKVLSSLTEHGTGVLWGLLEILAGRLHQTMTKDTREPGDVVVLLRPGPHWPAPFSFAAELGKSLARQTRRQTLVVNLGARTASGGPGEIDERTAVLDFLPDPGSGELEQQFAERLAFWRKEFANIIVNPVSPPASARCAALARLATHQGKLLGPGDSPSAGPGPKRFVAGAAPHPGLPDLSGGQQQVGEAVESERDYLAGQPVRPRFRRTVDSLARFVADLQVGLALGGGAAWGIAHVGVIAVLERAGFPLDVVAGCSMGSIIGAMAASGMTAAEMGRTAADLTRHPRRFVELRFWRMHLVSDRAVRRALEDHLGQRPLNEAVIPFWVNALNVQNGEEWTLRQGRLTDAVRASIALPGLLPPVSMGGGLLVDAGIINPVPVRQIRQMGCRYAIAVNAMQPLDAQPINRRYPFNMLDLLLRCFRISGHEMGASRCEAAADLMLTPRLGDISMLQFHRSAELIEAGERITEERLPAIRAGYERLRPPAVGAG